MLHTDGARSGAIGSEHGVTDDEWQSLQPRLLAAQEKLLARRGHGQLGFADLPFDTAHVEAISRAAQQVRHRFDHVVVLGIGGSALGLRCLVDALLGPSVRMSDRLDLRSRPQLLIFDNIDPDSFVPQLQSLDWKKTCVNVISKSGKTAETAAQFLIVREMLEKRFGSQKWKEQVIITTDPASGPLRAMVICEGMQSFSIPPNVGGRFSCLSPVGLFPAACAGVDIDELMAGARAMAQRCLADNISDNPAAELAGLHYLHDTRHAKSIAVCMPYVDALQRFSDWYVQLHAESLGKNGLGQTPLRAVGATDQHAQLQLFCDGPNNKLFTLLVPLECNTRAKIPASDEPAFSFLGGHDLGDLLRAEARATCESLREAARPLIRIDLPKLSAHLMGQLIFLYEWMIALGGELYGVDAFDQPGVERSKILTRNFLQK